MSFQRFICILLLVAAVSCQQSAPPKGKSSAKDRKAESKKETMAVTIDGREATREEKEAIRAWLSDAISRAIGKGLSDFCEKLGITDPLEAGLFAVSFGPDTKTGDELWSVYLVRPGKEIQEPRTTVLEREGKPIVRFTRATAPVERPIAVMSMTSMIDGRLTQTEAFFVYDQHGKWQKYRPRERKKRLKGEKE